MLVFCSIFQEKIKEESIPFSTLLEHDSQSKAEQPLQGMNVPEKEEDKREMYIRKLIRKTQKLPAAY